MSMLGLCFGTAMAVQLQAPVTDFTLSWTHSVEKIVWEEDYKVTEQGLILTEARIQGSGAGMDPPADAERTADGWRYRPDLPPLPRLTLARSIYTDDYRLCWSENCRTLTDLLGPILEPDTVDLFPCDQRNRRSKSQSSR